MKQYLNNGLKKHETVERMRVLGMTFLTLAEDNAGRVNMMCVKFNACGTVACHAGWFAVANNKSRIYNDYDYITAADEMAEYLGFSSSQALSSWAADNVELWGNAAGNAMFFFFKSF